MCLILFAYKVQQTNPLVLAANRDEWFSRPTAAADFWPQPSTIVAGRDCKAGGTWLGLSTTGRFAAITNYRNPSDRRADAPSRGELVSSFLAGSASARQFMEDLAGRFAPYNGFSMLAGDPAGLFFLSNRGERLVEVPPGIHGLSNHLLDTPWPKVTKGCAALESLLHRPFYAGDYLDMMDDSVPADEQTLPKNGANADWERSLSSMRILKGEYGTRCSTVVRLGADGFADFSERTYRQDGGIEGEVSHRFSIIPWPDQRAAASRYGESLPLQKADRTG